MARVLMLYLGSLMLRSMCIAAIAGVCTLWIRNVAVRHAIWVAVLLMGNPHAVAYDSKRDQLLVAN